MIPRHFPDCEFSTPDGIECHCEEWGQELREVVGDAERETRRNSEGDDA